MKMRRTTTAENGGSTITEFARVRRADFAQLLTVALFFRITSHRNGSLTIRSGMAAVTTMGITTIPTIQQIRATLSTTTTGIAAMILLTMIGITPGARIRIERSMWRVNQARTSSSLDWIPISQKQTYVPSLIRHCLTIDLSFYQLLKFLQGKGCTIETVTIIRDRNTGTCPFTTLLATLS